ncbi:peptidoglycan-binding LysM [Sphaerotilus natans subsp. natans DSM 6575]|uniref:Peptidoglycan-binding LysM n=1 Tax=Sphaerotilus natans subsp. natans DSM 6575 TaxID=1286631 RepID=A0A059KL24_9BURK|nr:LysM domain-containing protein [Sphaerotilus natans]KDB52182.1 peptidoglycan-binding LysM [Sphaerotilus natans subsp. natans DSM 6575]SIQ26629.1 LysM domain-containing protein [Sphaerotilus natans]
MILCHGEHARTRRALASPLRLLAATLLGLSLQATHAAPDYPVTAAQRSTARQVAEAGVPLSELAPNAPESHVVRRGDTLWDISKLFLRSPWRWPELWGMNLEQIRNPHLIYPGQELVLVREGGRARLQFGRAGSGTVKLSPRVRAGDVDNGPVASISLHLIEPFLNDAIVLEADELDNAPRIVAGREGRVLLGRGDTAYVRGEMPPLRNWRVFRQARPLLDPDTKALLGYEAAFVGSAEYVRPGSVTPSADGKTQEIVPGTVVLTTLRQEAGAGDRLAQAPTRDTTNFVPHAPSAPIAGRIVSIYGDGMSAGQNQIVALNRGRVDGIERGHVLAIQRAGERIADRTDPQRAALQLPDETHGHLFVFRVFERVAYALILDAQTAVRPGDRFTQP